MQWQRRTSALSQLLRGRSPWLPLISPVVVIVVLPFIASLVLMTSFGFWGAVGRPGSLGQVLDGSFSWKVIWTTFWLAARATFFCLLIGYPIAFALNNLKSPMARGLAFTVLFTPLPMSVIVRAYGWMVLLSSQGLVNSLLGYIGIGPFRLMLNDFGALIAMAHVMLPSAVLPLLSSINQLPPSGIEAARDLGASPPVQVLVRVIFPLTLPGILSAIEIVFALSASAFVTPTILGGGRVLTLPRLIYDNIGSLDWGSGGRSELYAPRHYRAGSSQHSTPRSTLPLRRSERLKHTVLNILLVATLVFMAAPILVVVINAFNISAYNAWPPPG
ncbi:putative ABC transporter permease component (plasmid) [Rhizobium johnstonii 3841]|uniref:ABC transporter permease component n=1 Tax=Rhizobium johnstonii (strain DSM 114642 / LMG 32736 / 3841) TaxID=216596 RepID=Q1M872_RHIJ3|nr:putative ABC transporter permease component [Rhizobium johnstonii 3841]